MERDSHWSLRLLGVGNAAAVELGSAMATIERDGSPWLTIDCGGEGLTAYQQAYGDTPMALFMTHAHMDHIAGFERLFVSSWFDEARRGKVRLYVPVTLLPLLQQRVASYPNALAEGGVNFWDAFHVVPVSDHGLSGEPPRNIRRDKGLYTLERRGQASAACVGRHDRPAQSRAATYLYRAGGREVLWVERWGSEVLVGEGQAIEAGAVSFLPGS